MFATTHTRASAPLVTVVGPLPPPYHGQSKNTEIIVNELRGRCGLLVFNLSAGTTDRTLSYHLTKLRKVAHASISIFSNSFSHNKRFYITPDPGWGQIYTLLLISLARVGRYKVLIHYRGFSYIDRKSTIMQMIVMLAGRSATHIFLCKAMRDQFEELYGGIGASLVVSNARHVTPLERLSSEINSSDTLRIGLLSNLSEAKGLGEFLDLVRLAVNKRLPIRGVLAGPLETEAERQCVDSACNELPHCLEYVGPIYGPAKHEFYRNIDVFVFPTRYATEAQPNVLFEALSFGVPVITFARGCISSDLENSGCVVICPRDSFVDIAILQLKEWHVDRGKLNTARVTALDRIKRLHKAADEEFSQLIRAILE